MILSLFLALAAEPAAAGPVDTLHKKVVEAIRNCPTSADGEITVCARDRGFAEKYRLQRLDPRYAEGAGKVTVGPLAGVGVTGAGSCTNIGASGATGCSLREENAWRAWKKEQKVADGRWFPW